MRTFSLLTASCALVAFATGCASDTPQASYSANRGYAPTGVSSSPAVYQSSAPVSSESTTELVQPVTQGYFAPAPPPRVYAPGPVVYMPSNVSTLASTPEDQAIANTIVQRVLASGAVRAGGPNFKVSVRHGKVHLTGKIRESWQHQTIKDIVRSTPGTRGIQDDLTRH